MFDPQQVSAMVRAALESLDRANAARFPKRKSQQMLVIRK
jgi:hypothetical protein